jgi:hypothetical protein
MQLSSETQDELADIKDKVSSWTSSKTMADNPPAPGPSKRIIGPSRQPIKVKDVFEEEERREREKEILRKDRRDFRRHNDMVMDELLPKATGGHAARMEKKKIRAESRREREMSPDMDESDVFGSDSKNIKDKLKKQQEDRYQRAHDASQKISDYQAKEKARVAAILEMAKANKKEGSLW